MKTKGNKTNMHAGQTGSENDLNYDFSCGDFDITGSEMDENQDYAMREDEENDNYSLGGEEFYDLEEG